MHTPRFVPLAVLLSLLSCGGGSSSLDSAGTSSDTTSGGEVHSVPSSEGAVFMESREITDPARGNRVAYHLLVPRGWEVEGGVTAVGPAYHMIPTISDVTVRAKDGRGVRFWSMLEYGYADGLYGVLGAPHEGRPFFPIPSSLGDHWQRMFDTYPAEGVSQLEVVSEEVLPQATKQMRKQLAPLYENTKRENKQLRAMGQSKDFEVEVRKLVIRYVEDSRRIEATVFATLRKTRYLNSFDGSIRAAMWNLDYMYAAFGPEGSNYLEDPVLVAIVRSRTEDVAWQEEIQRWYLAKNQQIVAEGRARMAAAARSAAVARTTESRSVLDISFEGWKSRNAANSAGQSLSVNAIHERTTYVEPGGTTVDLPSYYQNVYADGQGNYVLHNDANWTIQADSNWNDRDWQQINPQQ